MFMEAAAASHGQHAMVHFGMMHEQSPVLPGEGNASDGGILVPSRIPSTWRQHIPLTLTISVPIMVGARMQLHNGQERDSAALKVLNYVCAVAGVRLLQRRLCNDYGLRHVENLCGSRWAKGSSPALIGRICGHEILKNECGHRSPATMITLKNGSLDE